MYVALFSLPAGSKQLPLDGAKSGSVVRFRRLQSLLIESCGVHIVRYRLRMCRVRSRVEELCGKQWKIYGQ